jgi:ComF family protein
MSSQYPGEQHAGKQYSQGLVACQPMWRGHVDRTLRALTGRLWPSRCVLCLVDTQRVDFCAGCARDLPLNLESCRKCAVPLAGGSKSTLICGACTKKPPRFDTSFIPFRYAYPLDRMIQRLKYAQQLSIGRVLARSFAQQLVAARAEPWPDAIVPVPLGRARYLARGYNQAIELAQQVRGHIQVPLRTDCVVRVRETSEQAALARDARRMNVRGAFALNGQLDGAHVAILDDVVTTGSTVNEVATVLRKAGANRIEVWAIARAGR